MNREPFHSGELLIQERTGERARAILNGRGIADTIPPRAQAFLAEQQYCILAWASPAGLVWASFMTGGRGFASIDSTGSYLTLRRLAPHAERVPPFAEMRVGDRLGILFADLAARRRLRVNGVVEVLTAASLELRVEEAFGNCPKYIQRRETGAAEPVADVSKEILEGELLTGELRDWISSADTLFVASAHPDGRLDASHRGGNPGFVRVEDGILWVPDYPGNSMFGTLGNFAINPHGGVVFVDFERSRQLQLTGDVRLELERGDRAGETGGTGRWWTFSPERWIVSGLAPAVHWTFIEYSPFNPSLTGVTSETCPVSSSN